MVVPSVVCEDLRVDLRQAVTEFHQVYGLPVRDVPDTRVPEKQLRIDLIAEEFEELQEALAADDVVETADALADLLYVVMGAALTFGVPIDEVVDEVHRSNLSKLGEDGQPIRREDGKILKGPDFFTPDIAGVLERHR